MPKIIDRINLNFESFFKLRKLKFRNNTAFCEQMGEKPYWVTDLKRGKAIITPQKAARICILLQTTPEEILLHEGETEAETEKCRADIELVRELVAQMRKEGEKEAPSAAGEGLDPTTREIFDFVNSASDDELGSVQQYIQFLKSKRDMQ